MPTVLLIDNYDSFTYNLVQYLGELGAEVTVRRNDQVTLDEIDSQRPDGVVISPGPGHPGEAGITLDLIDRFAGTLPIFGVCLGHQAIGQAFGGEVVRAKQVMHGKPSAVHHRAEGLYDGLAAPFTAARYHSLVIKPETLPACLEVTAWTEDGTIMGVRHREHDVEGVQFHPESILTEGGHRLLANFLARL
jgi:anthranilate synthase/aminodeoxychorismate synthase-like glutamine amidotransferase